MQEKDPSLKYNSSGWIGCSIVTFIILIIISYNLIGWEICIIVSIISIVSCVRSFIIYSEHNSAVNKEYLKKKEEEKNNLHKAAEIEKKIQNFIGSDKIKKIEKEIKELTSKVKEIEEEFFK